MGEHVRSFQKQHLLRLRYKKFAREKRLRKRPHDAGANPSDPIPYFNGHQIYARTEPGDPPNYCTVFHHIVKSAGSTVKSIVTNGAYEDGVPKPGIRR